VLSLRPLVVEVPAFMSAQECAGVVSATRRQTDEKGCPECGTWWIRQTRASAADRRLVDQLESRLAELVGLPTHEGENVIKVTSYTPTAERSAYTVHHEKVGRPRRSATVLVFLVAPDRGGHTIFPAATTNKSVSAAYRAITPPRGRWWRLAEGAARSDHRIGSVGMLSPEADANVHIAARAAEARCASLADAPASIDEGGGEAGLAITPLVGKALVWYHEEAAAQSQQEAEASANATGDAHVLKRADPHAWHCGCAVRASDGQGGHDSRWALQKFKEWPRDVARVATFDAIVASHIAAARGRAADHVVVQQDTCTATDGSSAG
jgi:hypothetical protein